MKVNTSTQIFPGADRDEQEVNRIMCHLFSSICQWHCRTGRRDDGKDFLFLWSERRRNSKAGWRDSFQMANVYCDVDHSWSDM